MSLILLCCPAAVGAYKAKVGITGLLVWRQTTHLATLGYNYSTHIAILVSPCVAFNKISQSSKNVDIINSVLTCKELYEERVVNVMKQHCKVTRKINSLSRQDHHFQRRHRRFLPLIGAGVVGGILSYGVLAIKHYFEEKTVAPGASQIDEQMTKQIRLIRTNSELTQK